MRKVSGQQDSNLKTPNDLQKILYNFQSQENDLFWQVILHERSSRVSFVWSNVMLLINIIKLDLELHNTVHFSLEGYTDNIAIIHVWEQKHPTISLAVLFSLRRPAILILVTASCRFILWIQTHFQHLYIFSLIHHLFEVIPVSYFISICTLRHLLTVPAYLRHSAHAHAQPSVTFVTQYKYNLKSYILSF